MLPIITPAIAPLKKEFEVEVEVGDWLWLGVDMSCEEEVDEALCVVWLDFVDWEADVEIGVEIEVDVDVDDAV
jgi:hypothetical protein